MKKSGAATVATAIVLHGINSEVIASGSNPPQGILWEEFEIHYAPNTPVDPVCEAANHADDTMVLELLRDNLRLKFYDKATPDLGSSISYTRVNSSGLVNITGMTACAIISDAGASVPIHSVDCDEAEPPLSGFIASVELGSDNERFRITYYH